MGATQGLTDSSTSDPTTRTAADFEAASTGRAIVDDWVKDLGSGRERETFLVRLDDPAVPSYEGGINGLASTAPETGEKFDPELPAAREYTASITADQDAVIERASDTFGRSLDVEFRYTYAANGFAAVMSPDEARRLATDPAVEFIQRDLERELHTDSGPGWIEADRVWNASTELGLPEDYMGEGMVIGVIDTGINPSNPSFGDVGGDGFNHTNPKGRFFGACDPDNADQFDPGFPCNDKLIGAYGFVAGESALDYEGHGSHTSSTAGGNFVNEAEKVSPTRTDSFDISGVAPHANIISYLGCCRLAGITASIDQAIADGVDAINYSIGSTEPGNPWVDFDAVGFLNARAAGIFVATSNGNSGPGFATTGSPADAPWVISVGASTHDRANLNTVVDMAGGGIEPPADIVGRSVTSALGQTPVVYAGDFGDALCQATSGNQANFVGNIVVCDRGVIGRVAKSFNAAAQGAAGFILANDADNGGSLNGDAFAVPGVHITYEDGIALKEWLATGSGHTAAIAGTSFVVDDQFGDQLASFSSRGANRAVDVIVPDVVAPGVDILAAAGDANGAYDVVEYDFISGTSMSSPHVAGTGALMMEAHPDWTPAEIQSALMTTAVTDLMDSFDGSVSDPYDIGAGRVDVSQAALAQLVFDETAADYDAANPAVGGDPKTLNLPSFSNTQCLSTCYWTRTAEVPLDVLFTGDITWTATVEADPAFHSLTVSPSEFTVAPGDSQELTVTADVLGATDGETISARITLTPSNSAVPSITMPVAVVPSSRILRDEVNQQTRRHAGSFTIEDLQSIEVTEFTGSVAGLATPDTQQVELLTDPTNLDPYDNPDDVAVFLVDVGSNATRLIAELSDSDAPDMDLYVGRDEDGDGEAELGEEVASSTTPTGDEFVDISDLETGTWWVLVQNWEGSDDQPDAVTLGIAVVGDGVGNAAVDGPPSTPQEEPWDVTVSFSEPAMEPGDSWFGTVILGSSPSSPGDIGSIPIRIDRVDDDVTKSASVEEAAPGDTVSYEITVRPNVTDRAVAYTITDIVPDGLTVDENSITGGGVLTGNTIEWTIEMGRSGAMTWEEVTCGVGYTDLAPMGIPPQSVFDGDALAFFALANIGPFEFFGSSGKELLVTENGLITLPDGFGGDSQTQQTLPDAALPNSVIGGLWTDLIADFVEGPPGSESGVTIAFIEAIRLGLIEYDNLQLPNGDVVGDFQIVVSAEVTVAPEIEFHYLDNGDVSWSEFAATIGLEDVTGASAHVVLNDGDPSTVIDGDTSLCFDWINVPVNPVTVSYDATVDQNVDEGTSLVNTVDHITDDPHAEPVSVTAMVTVEDTPTTTSSTSTTSTTSPSTTSTSTTSTSTTSSTSPPSSTEPPPTTEPEPHPEFDDIPEDHLFHDDIIWLASEGITIGCNPPDNTLFCPGDSVTRGQMAAFLNRTFDLAEATDDHFSDDDTSVFEGDINSIADAGITVGCNPPVNDQFCPNEVVLRQQMASFLTRAYGFVDDNPGTDRFVDDDFSVHEPDIEALASAGVTLGCNPPDNDRFCPLDDVLREQMAAFLHRAESP